MKDSPTWCRMCLHVRGVLCCFLLFQHQHTVNHPCVSSVIFSCISALLSPSPLPPSPPSCHALSSHIRSLSRSSTSPLWCRGGSERVGGCGGGGGWWGRCLGMERRGAWRLVCLGAPNESVIHGTRGSHRDRIRGALSKALPRDSKKIFNLPTTQADTSGLRGCVRPPPFLKRKTVGIYTPTANCAIISRYFAVESLNILSFFVLQKRSTLIG